MAKRVLPFMLMALAAAQGGAPKVDVVTSATFVSAPKGTHPAAKKADLPSCSGYDACVKSRGDAEECCTSQLGGKRRECGLCVKAACMLRADLCKHVHSATGDKYCSICFEIARREEHHAQSKPKPTGVQSASTFAAGMQKSASDAWKQFSRSSQAAQKQTPPPAKKSGFPFPKPTFAFPKPSLPFPKPSVPFPKPAFGFAQAQQPKPTPRMPFNAKTPTDLMNGHREAIQKMQKAAQAAVRMPFAGVGKAGGSRPKIAKSRTEI